MSEVQPVAKPAKPKWIFAVVILLAVALVLGGAYAAAGVFLPGSIQASYQGKNCDSVLQQYGFYARLYPAANTEKAGISKAVGECATYKMAVIQEEQKAWQNAYQAYKAYAEAYPEGIFVQEAREHCAEALTEVAKSQESQKKYTEAIGTLTLVLKDYGETAPAANSAAQIAEIYGAWSGDLRSAKDFAGAKKVLDEFQGWAQANNQAGSVLSAQEAIAQTYLEWGASLGSAKDFTGAEKILNEFLAWAQNNKHAESVKSAKEALAANYIAWGRDLGSAKDFAGAEKTFKQLQTWAQNNQLPESITTAKQELAKTYLEWAGSLQAQKKYQEAKAKFDQVIATDPEAQSKTGPAAQARAALPALYLEWGNTLLAQNDFNGSLAQFQAALKLSEPKDQPAVKDLIVRVNLQWATELRKAEDYLQAVEKLKQAESDPGSEAAKKDLATALADTYQAFSNSSGRQAQQAISEAVKGICEKGKKPSLPIFGLDKTNIRAGLYGVDAKLPENVAAATPGALHYVACVATELKTVERRTFLWAVLVREQTTWTITLKSVATAETKAVTSLVGGTPPPIPAITRSNYIAILTSPYIHYPGSLPDMVDLANWLLTVLK